MAARRKVIVVQPAPIKDRVPLEILATNIRDIAASLKKLDQCGLERRVIELLVQDCNRGIPMSHVQAILTSLPQLEARFLKPVKS